jgi:hypothetical protein
MVIHELKSWRMYFERVRTGAKRCEVRRNDRGFYVNDLLHLREWERDPGAYTGRELLVRVTDIIPGGEFGIDPAYVVMSVKLLELQAVP